MVVGARQNFHFFRQKNWFLENTRALFKFLYGILHYLIGIIKSQNQSIKKQIYINHTSHLKKGPRHRCCPMNFAKFSETPILLKNCERLFLYSTRLISKLIKVCLYPIYCLFIWFNYLRIMNKKNAFNSFFSNAFFKCFYFKMKLVMIFNNLSFTRLSLLLLEW